MSCDTEHERKQQSKGKDENKGTRGRVREGDSAEGSSPTSREGCLGICRHIQPITALRKLTVASFSYKLCLLFLLKNSILNFHELLHINTLRVHWKLRMHQP